MPNPGKIHAAISPEGDGHQVTYELGNTRRVHHFPDKEYSGEAPPHGAGSFHDPEHHQTLIDRVEAMLLTCPEESPPAP